MAHGRYTIVGKLADGGMAEIFLAKQHGAEGFEKLVVLKRVLTAFSADPQFRNMFIDEAHISMSLSHGNIVQVLDVGLAGERTFLVLELVEGWDLEQILERAQATGPEHPWPPSLALYVTAQICRGLSYAHAKRAPDGRPLGIVHRDVNPTNVLVSEQGEVKLADFGIAKAERKREQTGAGIIKGKIGFMSPEQALGRALDARADLFSAGTMLYLMLTGRKPFEAPSELESMLRAQRAEFPPPETLNPYLPPEATMIVNRAMRKEASARYQTADEMLIDVERVLRSQYNSAGQTELKLWLSELARRDGAVPMGRLSAVPFPAEDGSGDLSAGVSVELSDVGVGNTQATAVAIPAGGALPGMPAPRSSGYQTPRTVHPVPGPPPRSTTPAVTPPPVQSVTPVDQMVTPPPVIPQGTPPGFPVSAPVAAAVEVPSAAVKRRSRRSRVGLGFVLGAVCMLGAVYGIKWLAAWAGREGLPLPRMLAGNADGAWAPAATPPAATPLPATPPVAAQGEKAVPADQPAPGDKAAPADQGPPQAVNKDGAGGATAAGPAEAAHAPPVKHAPEEEKATPGEKTGESGKTGETAQNDKAGDKTGDKTGEKGAQAEDEGETGAADKGGTADKGEDKTSGAIVGEDEAETSHAPVARKPTAHKTAARPPQPVMVRITSSPLGAEVRTKKQLLGRTPINIRFNPGNSYQLTFIKAGYVTSSRTIAVAGNTKAKSISVPMKKAPPPARRGLFRGR